MVGSSILHHLQGDLLPHSSDAPASLAEAVAHLQQGGGYNLRSHPFPAFRNPCCLR